MADTEATNANPSLTIVVNEVLYFLQNAVNILHKNDIIGISEEYFIKEDIESAKVLLWKSAGHLTEKSCGKRTGISAIRSHLGDMLELMKCIDVKKGNVKFASIDVTKVPPINADYRDIGLVRNEMKVLSERVDSLPAVEKELSELKVQMLEFKSMLTNINVSHENSKNSVNAVENVASSSSVVKVGPPNKKLNVHVHQAKPTNNLHAKNKDVVPSDNAHLNEKWTTVVKRKAIVGKNDTNKSLKAAVTVKKLDLHVTRLDIQTTAQELTDSITSNGLTVIACEELKARYNTYKSFRVTLDGSNANACQLMYDENIWPSGVMVRRFFTNKNGYRNKQ